MNLDMTDEIVDQMDPDFLWHSNNALRKELEKTKKELEIMQLYSLYWSEEASR